MSRTCDIPSRQIGACDLEWGHLGGQHSNAGDPFLASDQDQLDHTRRQAERASKDPTYRVRAHCHVRIDECRRIEQKFALDLSMRDRGRKRASIAPMAQSLIEAWTERMALERVLRVLDDIQDIQDLHDTP